MIESVIEKSVIGIMSKVRNEKQNLQDLLRHQQRHELFAKRIAK